MELNEKWEEETVLWFFFGRTGDGLQIELLILWESGCWDPEELQILNVRIAGDLVKEAGMSETQGFSPCPRRVFKLVLPNGWFRHLLHLTSPRKLLNIWVRSSVPYH